MTEDDYKLAKSVGWDIDCESPFELSCTEDGVEVASATGWAAEIVWEFIKENRKWLRREHKARLREKEKERRKARKRLK